MQYCCDGCLLTVSCLCFTFVNNGDELSKDKRQCEKCTNQRRNREILVRNMWEKVQHDDEAFWIKNDCHQNRNMDCSPVSEKEVTVALTTLNWKAPGRDQIPNYWLKQFAAIHKYLATFCNKS
jgi:hypothetical protein